MEKVNGVPLYWLGHSLGSLMMQLTNPSVTIPLTGALIVNQLVNARHNLNLLVTTTAALPLSKEAAKAVLINLDKILTPPQKLFDVLSDQEKTLLIGSIYHFQAVISAELPQANIYYVTPKRAYEMTTLINQGEKVFSQDTINILQSSKDDVIKEIRETTKCLAFDISTAVGFHVYRAIESIKFNAEDYGRKPVGESVPAVGWKY